MDAEGWDSRTRLLLGDEGAGRLANASVLVAGLGGVGGYVAEILARSGVGKLVLVDADTVSESNVNRQIIALRDTLGMSKAELWRQRLGKINPALTIDARDMFLTPDNIPPLLDCGCDYVADAIDTIAPKCALIRECVVRGNAIVSSMGAGGRLDPSQVRYGTLDKTCGDGLARTLRQRLRRQETDIRNVKVVWSSEEPARRAVINLDERNKRSSFGTLASIPALFGIFMANLIIRDIAGA